MTSGVMCVLIANLPPDTRLPISSDIAATAKSFADRACVSVRIYQ